MLELYKSTKSRNLGSTSSSIEMTKIEYEDMIFFKEREIIKNEYILGEDLNAESIKEEQ